MQPIEAGGIAAMEVLARDLKALGLYIARSLSYEGIEVEISNMRSRPEQIRIYDAFARPSRSFIRTSTRAQGRQHHRRRTAR